ncbi:MAG: sialate O-acetylesterase [Sphingobacteriaceae bacterium]|nr:sialate O-acetylesterase [Cytophagaceae bacterium]
MKLVFSLFGLFFVSISTAALAQTKLVPPKNLHLYLLAGQSNMAGRGVVEAQDRQAHPRVWVLNQQGDWVPAAEPLHFDKPAVAGVGPGFNFGKTMAELDTTVAIGLIPTAVGGSAISAWQPGGFHEQTKSYPYDDALRRLKTALPAGTLRGILWHQGESDSKPELSAVYEEKLTALIQRLRREEGAEIPFVVGTLGDFFVKKNANAVPINQLLKTLPARVSATACVEATGLTDGGDQTHFNAASARELGRRYAEAMRKLQKK